MQAFRLFDDDQSGNISTDELGAVLRGIGKKVTEKQALTLTLTLTLTLIGWQESHREASSNPLTPNPNA